MDKIRVAILLFYIVLIFFFGFPLWLWARFDKVANSQLIIINPKYFEACLDVCTNNPLANFFQHFIQQAYSGCAYTLNYIIMGFAIVLTGDEFTKDVVTHDKLADLRYAQVKMLV